jgi:phage-related protein
MEVVFYETGSGRSPVTKFIDDQPMRDQAIIIAVINAIEEDGLQAKGATFRQLDGKLWEIKIKAPSGGYRLLYVMLSANSMMLLHAFKKKTQKTPLNELAVARKRLAEVL